jgi:hypothetical protein
VEGLGSTRRNLGGSHRVDPPRLFRPRKETGFARDCVEGLAGLKLASKRLWSTKPTINIRPRAFASGLGRQDSHRYGTACASLVAVASCGPLPSMR